MFAPSIGVITARSTSRDFGWLATATDPNRRPDKDYALASAFVVLGHAAWRSDDRGSFARRTDV